MDGHGHIANDHLSFSKMKSQKPQQKSTEKMHIIHYNCVILIIVNETIKIFNQNVVYIIKIPGKSSVKICIFVHSHYILFVRSITLDVIDKMAENLVK